MSKEFPFPCVRCGFCCLSETCPVGQDFYGIGKSDPCPGLSFDGEGLATCEVAEKVSHAIIGVGVGCCIKATVYKNGVGYDFAALPALYKRMAVRQRIMQTGRWLGNQPIGGK